MRRAGSAVSSRVQNGAVRKQYHFWPSESGAGLDAWDVDRLVALSRDLPTEDLEVASVEEIDTEYWFDESSRPTVRAVIEHMSLVNEVDLSYPVILSVEGRVMDGMHRIARAVLEGRSTVPAVRLTDPVPPDLRNCHPDDLPY